jgi:hypothetical protein
MSKPNLYVMIVDGKEYVFSVSSLSEKQGRSRRATRKSIKRAIKRGEMIAAVVRGYNK